MDSLDLSDVETIGHLKVKMQNYFKDYRKTCQNKEKASIKFHQAKDEFDTYEAERSMIIKTTLVKKTGRQPTAKQIEGYLVREEIYGKLLTTKRALEARYQYWCDMIFAFSHGKDIMIEMSQNFKNNLFSED